MASLQIEEKSVELYFCSFSWEMDVRCGKSMPQSLDWMEEVELEFEEELGRLGCAPWMPN